MSGAARQLVKLAAAGVDVVRRPPPGLVVLIYHRVGRRASIEVDLPRSEFEAQVEWLAAHATVLPLGEAVARVTDPTATPDPIVAVTFDDGTSDFAEEAVPVLARHGVPATLYVATSFVEDSRSFPDDGAPISWSALRDVAATGLVDIGSHTHGHTLLDRLAPSLVADELDRSIDLIAEHVGSPPLDFAYPKAVMGSPAADAAVRARFRSAAVAGTRVNRYGATDPFLLSRSPIQVSDGRRWFEHKVRGGLGFEDSVRRVLNRRRYAGATT